MPFRNCKDSLQPHQRASGGAIVLPRGGNLINLQTISEFIEMNIGGDYAIAFSRVTDIGSLQINKR